MLSGVRVVESAIITVPPVTTSSPELDNNTVNNSTKGAPLQVGYLDAGQEYTLYLVAPTEQDRDDWINALRSGEKMFQHQCGSQQMFTQLLLVLLRLIHWTRQHK